LDGGRPDTMATPGAQQSIPGPLLVNRGAKRPSAVGGPLSWAACPLSGGKVPSRPTAPTARTPGSAAGSASGPPSSPAAATMAVPCNLVSATLAASSADEPVIAAETTATSI